MRSKSKLTLILFATAILTGKSVLAQEAAPPAPVGLLNRQMDSHTFQLSWQPAAGADAYRIYRASTATFEPSPKLLIGTVKETGFSDDKAGERNVYYYRIGLLNGGKEYAMSETCAALLLPPITKLKIVPRSLSAELHWDAPAAYDLPQVAGFDLYRRSATEPEIDPAKAKPYASLPKTYSFSDGGLTAGQTYIYQIAARLTNGSHCILSTEFSAAPISGTRYTQFSQLDAVAVIYRGSTAQRLRETDIEALKKGFETGREFIWRQSGTRLNVQVDYVSVNDLQDAAVFGADGLSAEVVARDLATRGVTPGQYDLVIAIYPATNEATVSTNGMLWNQTSFAAAAVPFADAPGYPQSGSPVTQGAIWQLVSRTYRYMNGADAPARDYSEIGAAMRRSNAYLRLDGARVLEGEDRDGDGLIDADLRTPMDERRYKGLPTTADSDKDGVDDRAEYLQGLYTGINPRKVDSDVDGFNDAEDFHPGQTISTRLPKKTVGIDGKWNKSWKLIADNVYFAENDRFEADVHSVWNKNSLNFAFIVNMPVPVVIELNCGDDDWQTGADNLQVRYNPADGKLTARALDATPEARRFQQNRVGTAEPVWDNDAYYINWHGRLVDESDFKAVCRQYGEHWLIELQIPMERGLGLVPRSDYNFDLRIVFEEVNASVFEPGRFVEMTLVD